VTSASATLPSTHLIGLVRACVVLTISSAGYSRAAWLDNPGDRFSANFGNVDTEILMPKIGGRPLKIPTERSAVISRHLAC